MSEKPRYFDSWKGRVAKAIVYGKALSWSEIRDQTGMSPSSFNKVLSEMINAKALEKQKDGTYRLEYNLYKSYQQYYEQTEIKQSNPVVVRIKESDQKDLIQWMDEWRSTEAPNIDPRLNHFYLSGAKLEEFSRKCMERAKIELVVVNPFVKQSNLTDIVRSSKANTRLLITRVPDTNDRAKVEEYQNTIKSSGARFFFNDRVHAKLIIVDRTIAIVSSMNFYASSGGGQSWEAGLITKEELVIEEIMNDVLILMDSHDTKEKT